MLLILTCVDTRFKGRVAAFEYRADAMLIDQNRLLPVSLGVSFMCISAPSSIG